MNIRCCPVLAVPMAPCAVPRIVRIASPRGSASWDDDLKYCREECALRRLATLTDAEWGGPPDHQDALPEPAQAAGWEWELDANGVPVQNQSTTASAARGPARGGDRLHGLPAQDLRTARPRGRGGASDPQRGRRGHRRRDQIAGGQPAAARHHRGHPDPP